MSTSRADLNEDVEALRAALLNEKMSPEILYYQSDLVENLKEQLDNQQGIIDDAEDADKFDSTLYQMEIDRIKYMLTSYLRLRLLKLEKMVFHITSSVEFSNRLSEHELQHAKSHLDSIGNHLDSLVLQHLPDKFKSLADMTPQKPDLGRFVFCRVLDEIGELDVGHKDGGRISLQKGDAYVLRYSTVQGHLFDGQVQLV